MVRKLGKNHHGCSIFELGCASEVRVGPAVRSCGQRAARKLVGLRRTPMLAMRRQETFRIEHQGASPERLHRLSDFRFDVRTCFFLPLRGRVVLETVCDRFAFPGDRRALGKTAFARSPALPVLLRCRRAARIARAFLRIKNRKSGLARTNAFHYYISSRRGRGSAGRARPCQGRGRGFEPRRPLHRLREAGHT